MVSFLYMKRAERSKPLPSFPPVMQRTVGRAHIDSCVHHK